MMHLHPKNIVKVIILLSFLSITNISYAQKNNVDSLKQILTETEDDSSKAKILLQLARLSKALDREKSIEYYLEALQFKMSKYDRAVTLDTIGLFNWQLGNVKNSLGYFSEALILFQELKDSVWLGKINNNIGTANWVVGNSIEALEHYQIGLKIRKAINDMKGVSTIQNNIRLPAK